MDAHGPPSVALTSLLNSLHTHLQSQTQLLPTLHAQLGLPTTAIEDELTALQQQLAECVEARVDVRRKQVDEWMGRCDEVERVCVRYCAALGAHVKVAGSSVGERRKEMVLPRRYQMVSEYQEKLRQLYHTKLEQLNTLTNRINALSRTLGTAYFPPDILQPAVAMGGDASDIHRDVTPERFSKLEKELVRGKAEVGKRLSQLHETLTQIDWLYTELGIEPPPIEDAQVAAPSTLLVPPSHQPHPSCGDTSDPFLCSTPTPIGRATPGAPLLFSVSSTSTTPSFELTPHPSTSAAAAEQTHRLVFARFSARLAQAEAEGEALPDGAGLEGVDPTPTLLEWAERTRGGLEDQKRGREAHIQAMYDQLEALWRRLGVPDADMDAFVDQNQGSTDSTIAAYEDELERMMELKRERMGVFVDNARAEIEKLWDELMVGQEEKADFAPFADDEYTEELLAIHEEEIRRLKEERRMKAHLLVSIRKYFDISEEEKELAAAASDQSRLLGRGQRDPGRLLREEKMRKRVNKEKPRLEQDLLASIPAWEAEAGRPFLVHGESIMALLLETSAATDTAKENKRRQPSGGRAGSVPARATTPTYVSNSRSTSSSNGPGPAHQGYMPAKSTGVVTPAVRSASVVHGSQSVPNKRQRLTEPSSTRHTGRGGRTPSTSALPRPAPATAAAHKTSASGRAGAKGHARGVLQHTQPRVASNGSSTGTAPGTTFRMYGAAAAAAPPRKVAKPKRESFKPRPSEDAKWAPTASVGRWPGIAGVVKEEDEG